METAILQYIAFNAITFYGFKISSRNSELKRFILKMETIMEILMIMGSGWMDIHELQKEIRNDQLDSIETKEHNIKIKQHERNINAHMSLHGTLVGLSRLNLRYCKMIVLMHLSDRYANEYLMKNEVMRQTGVRTYVAGKEGGIH